MKKVFNRLIQPHKILLKISEKINFYLKYKKYDQIYFEKEQNDIFNSLGLDRDEGIKNLNLVKNKLEKISNVNRKMSSEHEIIFSSLSLNKNISVKDILEIGTFDGFNSLLLSNLFINSNIDTIDLPENDDDFINFYNRKDKIKQFISERNKNLSENKNINFYPLNSLNLLNHKKKYDLIWIDGAHGYPVVCSDIINSLHLIKEKGVILCDDVFLNLDQFGADKMHFSLASYETLNELKKQKLIKFTLVYKRLTAKANCIKSKRKFIAFVSKI